MKKLFAQIIKFGLVGGICFLIDFGITMGLTFLKVNHLVAAMAGFIISVIVNYLLSFRFVFKRKESMNHKKSFIIFLVLSVVGLGINELIIYLCVDILYIGKGFLNDAIAQETAVAGGKIIATAIVMVFNFITRKIFLEEKEQEHEEAQ
ncbi:MAG: GtrA family protein [Lachnospiraceae bacterium]|nr:GtrA family protein [Lachnospiraceae bacterium]